MQHKVIIFFVVGTFASSVYPIALVDAMFKAAEKGDEEGVRKALREGADKNVDIVNSQGWTITHIAASIGNTQIIELMHHYKADLDANDPNGMTPYLVAVAMGHTEAMRALLDFGARKDTVNRHGQNAEYLAKLRIDLKKDTEMIKLVQKPKQEEEKYETRPEDEPQVRRTSKPNTLHLLTAMMVGAVLGMKLVQSK